MGSLRVWVIAIVTGSLLVAAAFVLLSGNANLGWLVPLPIIGLVVGGLIMPLTETAGGMLRASPLLAGVVGSVAAGMVAARMGLTLFGRRVATSFILRFLSSRCSRFCPGQQAHYESTRLR